MSIWEILVYLALFLLIINFIRKTIAGSKIKNYNADEAKLKIKENSVIMLDVRTVSERNTGFIKGSLHIPLNQLLSRTDELKKFQNKEFICYCRSGNRSLNAAVILNKKGFNASNLRGGFIRWNY